MHAYFQVYMARVGIPSSLLVWCKKALCTQLQKVLDSKLHGTPALGHGTAGMSQVDAPR